MTVVQDYEAVVIGLFVTTQIGRKSSDIEAVVKDNNAESILSAVLSDPVSTCEWSRSDKMLLDLW